MTAVPVAQRGTTSAYVDPVVAPRAAFVAEIRALSERAAAADVPAINDLREVRSRLLEEAQAFLSNPEVSATGYVKGIAIARAREALDDVARIDTMIARRTAPAEAEGEQQ